MSTKPLKQKDLSCNPSKSNIPTAFWLKNGSPCQVGLKIFEGLRYFRLFFELPPVICCFLGDKEKFLDLCHSLEGASAGMTEDSGAREMSS